MDLSDKWAYLQQVAEERLLNNRTVHHVDKYGPSIELIGAAGELAARRFFCLSEDLHTRFDGGADLLFNDIRIDVKATVWTPKLDKRSLQWPPWKPIRADVILMTAINANTRSAILVGYALPHQILKAPINPQRDIPCHEIPIPRLNRASRLLRAQGPNDFYIPQAQASGAARHYSAGARA